MGSSSTHLSTQSNRILTKLLEVLCDCPSIAIGVLKFSCTSGLHGMVFKIFNRQNNARNNKLKHVLAMVLEQVPQPPVVPE